MVRTRTGRTACVEILEKRFHNTLFTTQVRLFSCSWYAHATGYAGTAHVLLRAGIGYLRSVEHCECAAFRI